ncbi:MAG: hypothetical protein OEY85_03450 [Rhodospirillales bacterium]|nr:hypothetical protein [Rhodospirillales bacterium]
MKPKTLAITAILLWAISAAFVGFTYVKGTTVTAVDDREAVVLEPAELDFVLVEMRGFLAAVQEIIAAANTGDMDAARKTSKSFGLALANTTPPETVKKLPKAFKQLAFSTHEGFDEVSLAADMGSEAVMEALEGTLSVCVSCHEVFRFTLSK